MIDEFGPLPLLRPQSVAELGAIVRQVAGEGQALYPVGGQTMLGFGLPPTRAGVAVDLRGLDQIIDYPARDMTVTVQAGITLARLHELLATENQRLPVDVPKGDRATLGGALATNTSGPHRFGFGTLRDYVIGISAVNDEGQEIKAGGRVVKNVAGYDLCKLFIGSLGTLGIITQVTLKLKPRPEEQALLTLPCQADGVESVLELVQRSRTRPSCLDVVNGRAIRLINQQAGTALPESPWSVVVGFEDTREVVCWQVKQLIKEMPAGFPPGLDARVGKPAELLWGSLVELTAPPEARLTFKANLLPSATWAFCQQAAGLWGDLVLQAHAGNGIVIGHLDGELDSKTLQGGLQVLQDSATAARGNLVLFRCPPAWKAILPVWGAARGDAVLMRAIKEKLDPRRLFNPGRFVDGI